jgi:putative ABC transport system permease protein
MHLIDVFRIALRMFKTNILRSLLTVFGIGIAISFIVVLIGLGYGVQNITVGSIVESKTLLSMDILPDSRANLALNDETLAKLQKLSGIDKITPVVNTSGQIQTNDKLAVVSVTGALRSFFEMEGLETGLGVLYEDGQNQAVISSGVAELLDLTNDQIVGKTISVNYSDPNNQNVLKHSDAITIVGVLDKVDTPAIYMPYSLFTTEGPVKIAQFKATAKDRDAVANISTTLVRQGYQVDSLIETLDQAKTIFRWVTIGLAIFGTISLLVAAIGMFNTLTIALLERTREIGIMKAIGVTDQAVQQIFLAEASMIGFLGGAFGVGVGLFVDQALSITLSQLAKHFNGTQTDPFQYPNFFLITMMMYPIVLALLTGLYPAIRAAKLNPLKALRYE